MSSKRVRIGITGPDEGGTGAWIFTALSVWLAGGKPVRIQPKAPKTIDDVDGLIIGGGADVEPGKYGEEPIPKQKTKKKQTARSVWEWILSIIFFPVYWLARYFQKTKRYPVDKKRDELEFGLLEEALNQTKPVLGICRGMQLINVHCKGSLHQDIRGFYKETAQISSILPKKSIVIEEGSKLHKILGTTQCMVNGLHNQAIKVPGKGIRMVAKEELTSVQQALEHEDFAFVIGVQWHPEYLIQHKRQRKLFKNLVACAEENCRFSPPAHTPASAS